MCAYKVYQGSSLQSFIDDHSRILCPDSLFGSSLTLVVQNRSMGEWLKLKLAEKRGISGDSPYVLPEKAMRELAEGYRCVRTLLGKDDSARPVLYMDNLKIRLYKIMEELFADPSGVPESCRELYAYITSSSGGDEKADTQIRSTRLYQLADSIAGLFSHYGMNTLPLVNAWDAGHGYEDVPAYLKKHETWQRFLWEKVYDSGLSLSRIFSTINESNDAYDGDVKRVVLFGSSFLGDTALQFFHRLSRDIQVDHFILTPSARYTSFIPAEAAQLSEPKGNPLLESWCTQMDGFARFSAGMEKDSRINLPEGSSILETVQKGILEDTPVPSSLRTVETDDRSLTIHGCTSPWREVEVLKDLLLHALDKDETLQLTDIAVLAPDINTYAPFLEALFPSEDEDLALPYNLIDLDSAGLSPLIQGFQHIFTLPGARFLRSELFVLFDNPCFREAQGMSRLDRKIWLELCEEMNIKWGYDREHRSSFFRGTGDFNSWERAFDRIKEGLFLDEEDDPGRLPAAPPDEETGRSWGNLMVLMQSLYNDLFELDRLTMPLEHWVLLAESVLESYFKVRKDNRQDESDWFRLKGCFRDILNMAAETALPGGREYDFFVFRTLLNEYISKSSGVKGRYLTQGITCSSLKPMRAIPFRRIYVLGLNEAAFPGEDAKLSFDLKECFDKGIDLSRRGGDRYAFLETLLSAEESLTLFYKSRNSISGEVLQPSILISELLDYLKKSFSFPGGSAEEDLITQESIHSFDPRYFTGGRSFNRAALESALLLQNGEREDTPENPLVKVHTESESGEIVLSLDSISRFLKNPVAWFYRNVLHIYLDEEESPELDSRENWELPFLEKYSFYKNSLWPPEKLENPALLESYVKTQQIKGNLPESGISFLEVEELKERLETMKAQAEDESVRLAEEWEKYVDVLIDPERGSRSFSDDRQLTAKQIPELSRKIRTADGEELTVHITGVLESLAMGEEPGVWKTLEYCESGSPKAKHNFESILKFLILSVYKSDFTELHQQKMGRGAGKEGRYKKVIFRREGEARENEVVLDDPEERLDRLIRLCVVPEENILPLYPELGEALAGELKASPLMSDRELLSLWKRTWMDSLNDRWNAGDLQGCKYRSLFLSSPPEIDVA
ncbi:MAG: exodeoxyribonuclease V subunit gamma, partial [Spirochaetales bacterium]|nr:exodeoxyribonuclease V subunit gamma [Spirochaetales bacterium]